MRIKTEISGFARIWNLAGLPTRILILMAACVLLPAAPLQKEAVRNECLKYQDPNNITPQKKFRHAALDKGCVSCHMDCSQISQMAAGQEMPAYLLKAKQPGLCLECHSASKQDLSKAHDNQPLGQVQCSGCHEPHSSNSPKRIPDVSHGPYDARMCSACHSAPSADKIQLITADSDALCYECHAEFKARMDSAKSRHTLFSESKASCVECHDPHATNQRYFLKKPARDLCLGCHIASTGETAPDMQSSPLPGGRANLPPKQPEKMRYLNLSSKYIHKPALTSCLYCHDAHASDYPNELHAPKYEVCLSCHGTNAKKIIQSTRPFSLFEGRVNLPAKTFETLSSIDLSAKYVHEPVGISCLFCHNAHASDHPTELHAPVHDLCIACHGANAKKIIKSEQSFMLFGSQVSLPPGLFKKLQSLDLSTDGKRGHPEEGHPVYVPAKDKKPEFNCLSCHAPHATDANPQLVVKHKDFTCLDCHN
jgi:predicted CXXCH cytochrome family protein